MSSRFVGHLTLRNFQIGAKDAALAGVVTALLGPIELPAGSIDSYTHAPFGCIRTGTRVALARIHNGFDTRTIKIAPHHTHAFAI